MKALRRFLCRRRIAHWESIVENINQVEVDIPAQRKQALARLTVARDDLMRVDRAPIVRAIGPGRRDGVNRNPALTTFTPFNRKVIRMQRQQRGEKA